MSELKSQLVQHDHFLKFSWKATLPKDSEQQQSSMCYQSRINLIKQQHFRFNFATDNQVWVVNKLIIFSPMHFHNLNAIQCIAIAIPEPTFTMFKDTIFPGSMSKRLKIVDDH